MSRRRQQGFAVIAAIVLLVVAAGLTAAMMRLTSTQQSTVNQALLGARASLAARSGVEWMIYQIVNDGQTACPTATTLTDFHGETGFRVSVSCNSFVFNEGESVPGVAVEKHIYHVDAVACNGATASCPDDTGVSSPDYAERKRTATICMTKDGKDCY
ncbi:MAG: MSHA biogenesis protein MshP [Lysobacteraceae bacterium]|nr:MAG: MSHA biogenesis protein MshP [Xanthomonadaceae bacterium]